MDLCSPADTALPDRLPALARIGPAPGSPSPQVGCHGGAPQPTRGHRCRLRRCLRDLRPNDGPYAVHLLRQREVPPRPHRAVRSARGNRPHGICLLLLLSAGSRGTADGRARARRASRCPDHRPCLLSAQPDDSRTAREAVWMEPCRRGGGGPRWPVDTRGALDRQQRQERPGARGLSARLPLGLSHVEANKELPLGDRRRGAARLQPQRQATGTSGGGPVGSSAAVSGLAAEKSARGGRRGGGMHSPGRVRVAVPQHGSVGERPR